MATNDLVEALSNQIEADHNDWLSDLQEARIEREKLSSSWPTISAAYADSHEERIRLLSIFLCDRAHIDKPIPRSLSAPGLRHARWIYSDKPFIQIANRPFAFASKRHVLDIVYDVHSRMTRDLAFKVVVNELDIEFKVYSRRQLIQEAGKRIESEIWRRLDADLEIPMPIHTESHPDAYELVPIRIREELALECLRRNWQLALIVLEAKHKLFGQKRKAFIKGPK